MTENMVKLGQYIARRLRQPPSSTGGNKYSFVAAVQQLSLYTTGTGKYDSQNELGHRENRRGKWFVLPPFSPSINGSALGKVISVGNFGNDLDGGETTALKWILRCCPELPRSLVQKLFRLRQVRREAKPNNLDDGSEMQQIQLKRVAAKDSLNVGDQIHLPISVQELPAKKQECVCSEDEIKYLRSTVLYKDSAIIVINKPPGMPVQGGIGIKRSLDELAATCLTFDYTEPPRLVHRLDRDCSGLLVLARTQLSATVLHSIFREKTSSAAEEGRGKDSRILQRKYWALVIGSPKRPKGFISAPLRKVVVDDGKSDRITVNDDGQVVSSQHAITEYQVIQSSPRGFTWLELFPRTGRKHQLRVHCAEVLGTPIVGDYKYGWQAHKNWQRIPPPDSMNKSNAKTAKGSPFDLDLEGGSITSKQPYLHLHCREMILPDIAQVLENIQISDEYNPSELESAKFVAPLPTHMQLSEDLLNS